MIQVASPNVISATADGTVQNPEGDLLAALRGLAAYTEGVRFKAPPQGEIGAAERRLASVLEEETATHLYRIDQEAVSNVGVHGKGGETIIRLGQDERILLLEVEDDGMGFEPEAVDKEASSGLRSMGHRAELIGAGLAIEFGPGEGTLVRVQLSL